MFPHPRTQNYPLDAAKALTFSSVLFKSHSIRMNTGGGRKEMTMPPFSVRLTGWPPSKREEPLRSDYLYSQIKDFAAVADVNSDLSNFIPRGFQSTSLPHLSTSLGIGRGINTRFTLTMQCGMISGLHFRIRLFFSSSSFYLLQFSCGLFYKIGFRLKPQISLYLRPFLFRNTIL